LHDFFFATKPVHVTPVRN